MMTAHHPYDNYLVPEPLHDNDNAGTQSTLSSLHMGSTEPPPTDDHKALPRDDHEALCTDDEAPHCRDLTLLY